MKKLLYILIPLLLASCELIPEDEQLIPVGPLPYRSRTLVTEFTGFLCVNCPNAALAAHELLDLHGDSLVVVEMHPASNTFCQTQKPEYDFTCPAADVYYKHLGGSATTGFPTGVVDFTSGLQDYTAWPALVSASRQKQKQASLSLSVQADTNRSLSVSYSVSATAEPLSLNVLFWLVEDSIVGPQRMPDGSTNMSYVHNHVLRTALTPDPWGIAHQAQADDAALHQLTALAPDSVNGQAVRLSKCAVVAVALDAERHVQDVVQCRVAVQSNE